jgi:hypothetical protein
MTTAISPKNPGQIPFLFITINNSSLRGDNMARSHYSFKKRKKELAKKPSFFRDCARKKWPMAIED